MANFNTNQSRQLYVALTKKDTLAAVTNAGDIACLANADGDIYFVYKNADGLVTRTDLIPKGKIEYYNKKTAAELALPLVKHTLTLDSGVVDVTNASNYGKVLYLTIKVGQFGSFNDNDLVAVNVEVGLSSSTNTPAKFYAALANAIVDAMPKPVDKAYPMFRVFNGNTEVTKAAPATSINSGVVLVATPQKWIRGKMTNEPFDLTFDSTLYESNVDVLTWCVDTKAASDVTGYVSIPAKFALADLEWFTTGERGDMYRESIWPHNYDHNYMINPAAVTDYDVLTIQYFWNGTAEDVQKSPRTLQIAAPAAEMTKIYTAFDAIVNPPAETPEP